MNSNFQIFEMLQNLYHPLQFMGNLSVYSYFILEKIICNAFSYCNCFGVGFCYRDAELLLPMCLNRLLVTGNISERELVIHLKGLLLDAYRTVPSSSPLL